MLLITGGAGFIGSHLADYLFDVTDQSLVLLDDFSTGSQPNIAHLSGEARVEIVEGDIRNRDLMSRLVGEADTVYHLAAAVGVRRVVDDTLDSLKTNLFGTEAVLEAAAADGTPVFIASSSEVYGKNDAVPFAEDNNLVFGPTTIPRWGYGIAKAADEFLALAYHEQRELPVTVGRFFNVVGPRQTGEYGMVIPRFVNQALAGDELTVYDDGRQTRSFVDARDAVEAVHNLLNTSAATGRIFNIGREDPVTIEELARLVVDRCESDSEIEYVPFETIYGEDFEEPTNRHADTTALRSVIDWEPDRSLTDIVDAVIAEAR
jgi:UDP-glucose 4-epimerase